MSKLEVGKEPLVEQRRPTAPEETGQKERSTMLQSAIVIVVFLIAAAGAASAHQLLLDTHPMLRAENARLTFSIWVLCTFFWWAVLMAFAIVFSVEAGQAYFLKRTEAKRPKQLRSGEELRIYY